MEQENVPQEPFSDPRLIYELPEPAQHIVNEYLGNEHLQQNPSLTHSDLIQQYAGSLSHNFIQSLYATIQDIRTNQLIIHNNTQNPFNIHATAGPNLQTAALSCFINYLFQNIVISESQQQNRVEFDQQYIDRGKHYSLTIPHRCFADNKTYVGVCAHNTHLPEVFEQCYVPVSKKGAVLELVRKNYGLGLSRRIEFLNTLSTIVNAKMYKFPLISQTYFDYFKPEPYSRIGPDAIDPSRRRALKLYIPFNALNNYFFPKQFALPNPKALMVNIWEQNQVTRRGFSAISSLDIHMSHLLPIHDVSSNFNIVQTYDDNLRLSHARE